MEITLEQVEKVRSCTGCSYEEAKAALEQAGGNVLDAVILLENGGAASGGDYSTRGTENSQDRGEAPGWRRPTGREVRHALGSLFSNCLAIVLEVWSSSRMTCRVPLLAAAILVVVQPYLCAALALLGLCFGYRIHLAGKGTEVWGARVNQVMDQIGDTVSDAFAQLRGDRRKKNRKK